MYFKKILSKVDVTRNDSYTRILIFTCFLILLQFWSNSDFNLNSQPYLKDSKFHLKFLCCFTLLVDAFISLVILLYFLKTGECLRKTYLHSITSKFYFMVIFYWNVCFFYWCHLNVLLILSFLMRFDINKHWYLILALILFHKLRTFPNLELHTLM